MNAKPFSRFDIIHLVDRSDLSPLMKAFANLVLVRMTDDEANRIVTLFRRAILALKNKNMDELLTVLSDVGLNEKNIATIADGITQKQ
jgi:hypothetical protein